MEKFNLFGQEIIFSDAECRHKEIDGIYLLRSKEAYDEYMDFYKNTSREEPGKFIQALKNKCFNIVKGNLEKLQKDLIETKIYSYDLERLTTEYSTQIWGGWSTRIEDLEDEFNTIIEEKNNEIQYRNIRKESRGKWQGGGFGVTGALKGAATAGVFNGITGAGHTVVNVLGNASTRSQTRKKLRDLVNNKSYCSELATDLQMQIKQLKKVYIHILNKEIGEHIKEYSSKDMLEHARVCGNMESVLDDTEKKCLILKLIKLYPYDIMQYKYAIEKFGDAYGEIEAISTFFNLEVKDYKINLLNKELKDVDYTDEKSMLQVKEALMIREKELGIENSELTKMLENKLTEFDIKMRTVADIDSTY